MSGINIGVGEASAIKIGGANATAVYAGTEQLWPMRTPPSYNYPASGVDFKKHGHSYGDRDVDDSWINWGADQRHQITQCPSTSRYTCTAGAGGQIQLTENTVYLVEYKIRARAYQQCDTSFYADAGVVAEKTGRPLQGIQTTFPNGGSGSAPNLWSKGREQILWWTASTSPSRETSEIPPDQMDLTPETRGYNIYSKFKTLVRKTGPGNFGQNEQKIWDEWQTRAPNTSGDHNKWREAEGECYVTVETLDGNGFQPAIRTECNTSPNGRTGMDVIFDKLVFTPVTEADHI
jgi:hypothetical protein